MNFNLSKEQEVILKIIESGENVFFTGPAGTGKSAVLRSLRYSARLNQQKLFFTAPTGIAAVNVAGSTIHSFAGIGLGQGSPLDCVDRVKRNKEAVNRWKDCKLERILKSITGL